MCDLTAVKLVIALIVAIGKERPARIHTSTPTLADPSHSIAKRVSIRRSPLAG